MKIKIITENFSKPTRVFLDGIEQQDLIDIKVDFNIAERRTLQLTYLVREMEIEGEADVDKLVRRLGD